VGVRFSASIQTVPGAHPASYTMGTRSFSDVKCLGCGVNHLPPTSTEVKGRVDLLPFCSFMAAYKVNFTFYFILQKGQALKFLSVTNASWLPVHIKVRPGGQHKSWIPLHQHAKKIYIDRFFSFHITDTN
jgi:hypothetical protein